MATAKRRMTLADFVRQMPLLPTMRQDRIEAAKLVLVDGKTLQEVADMQGQQSRQTILTAVQIVWDLHLRLQAFIEADASPSVPPGWTSLRVITPVALIDDILGMIDRHSKETEVVDKALLLATRKARGLNADRAAAVQPVRRGRVAVSG